MNDVAAVLDSVTRLAQGGLMALTCLVFLALILGWVQPRANVTRAGRGHDALVVELRAQRDTWKAAHDEAEQARREQESLLTVAVTEIRETVKTCRPTPPTWNGVVPHA